MPALALLLLAVTLLFSPAASQAAAYAAVPAIENPGGTEEVARRRRCGRGQRWVKPHRTRDGEMVKGRCVAKRKRHR